MSQIIRKGVKSLSKSGSVKLTDDVTLSEGSNITLTQTGNDIEIAAAGGGGSGDVTSPGINADNAIARFDGADSKVIQGSAVTIDDEGMMTVSPGAGPDSGGLIVSGTTNGLFTDKIGEATSNAGVTIDGVPIKDGEVDGRDIATDGSKLDGIEAGADVTDATNVAAAGAVMESDTSTASMSFVLDEDNMASDSATKLATQQSIKAYVDNEIGGLTKSDVGLGNVDNTSDANKPVSTAQQAEIDTKLDIVDYSTSEHDTGIKWIDGKPIYRKVVDFGALPNATTKNVAHGITNMDMLTDLRLVARNTTSGARRILPLISISSATSQGSLALDNTNVTVNSGADVSAYNQSYAVIEYTKT